VLAAGVAVWCVAVRPDLPVAGLLGVGAVAAAVALTGYAARYRGARTRVTRARLQWPAWGALTAAGIALVAALLDALVDWPSQPLAVAVLATVLVPLAVTLGAHPSLPGRIERLRARDGDVARVAVDAGDERVEVLDPVQPATGSADR